MALHTIDEEDTIVIGVNVITKQAIFFFGPVRVMHLRFHFRSKAPVYP